MTFAVSHFGYSVTSLCKKHPVGNMIESYLHFHPSHRELRVIVTLQCKETPTEITVIVIITITALRVTSVLKPRSRSHSIVLCTSRLCIVLPSFHIFKKVSVCQFTCK